MNSHSHSQHPWQIFTLLFFHPVNQKIRSTWSNFDSCDDWTCLTGFNSFCIASFPQDFLGSPSSNGQIAPWLLTWCISTTRSNQTHLIFTLPPPNQNSLSLASEDTTVFLPLPMSLANPLFRQPTTKPSLIFIPLLPCNNRLFFSPLDWRSKSTPTFPDYLLPFSPPILMKICGLP